MPLPTSSRPQPWMVLKDESPDDYVVDLLTWLQEEIDRDCFSWAFVTIGPDGVPEFAIEPYGFRMADDREHSRLLAAAGENGTWE